MEANFFSKNRKIFLLFLLFSLILIFVSTFSHRSLFFDAPAMFIQLLLEEDAKWKFYMFIESRTRLLSSFLLLLPYNALVRFIDDVPLYKIDLFAFSYQFSLWCALIFNYILAKRTKRYDIALLAFIFYSFFYLPNSVWYVKELHIAIMLQLALLQYFLTEKKFAQLDYLIMILLIAFCFESYENSCMFGFVLFCTSLLFCKKNCKNKKEKIFIGLFGLLNTFYVILKTYFMVSGGSACISFKEAFNQYFVAFKITFSSMFNGILILSLIGLFFIFVALYSKKKFKNRNYVRIIFIMTFTIFFIFNEFPTPEIELHYYILPCLLFTPIVLIIILCDYFNFSIKRECVKYDIFLITCLTGFCYILLQLYSCSYSLKYFNLFKEKLRSENTFEKINVQDANNSALKYNTDGFGQEYRSIILYQERTIKTIVVSKDSNLKVDFVNNIFYIDNINKVPIKTKYWNLAYIADHLKNKL